MGQAREAERCSGCVTSRYSSAEPFGCEQLLGEQVLGEQFVGEWLLDVRSPGEVAHEKAAEKVVEILPRRCCWKMRWHVHGWQRPVPLP